MTQVTPPAALRRLITPVVTIAATLVVLVVVPATAASAHVSSSEEPVASGGRTPVTFRFDHGCAGQPTTSLRVQIPPGVRDVVAEDPPGWASTVSTEEIRWQGGSIPDAQVATFVAIMTIDEPDGTTVRFPTLQGCPTAESAWIQIPDATNPEPEYPAPQIVVGTATDAALAAEPTAPTTTQTPASSRVPLQDTPITSEGSDQSTAGLVVFIVVVGIIAGGAATLYLRHRGGRPG